MGTNGAVVPPACWGYVPCGDTLRDIPRGAGVKGVLACGDINEINMGSGKGSRRMRRVQLSQVPMNPGLGMEIPKDTHHSSSCRAWGTQGQPHSLQCPFQAHTLSFAFKTPYFQPSPFQTWGASAGQLLSNPT